jgi:hypothetical protein
MESDDHCGLTMEHRFRLSTLLPAPSAIVEVFILLNVAFLAADIYVAHSMNGFAHWAEWIPFGYSLTAPILLAVAMALSWSVRPSLELPDNTLSRRQRASGLLGLFVGWAAIIVGIMGLLWHLNSQFFADATLKNLVYTAPFVAPLAYTGLGLLILLNRMVPCENDEWGRWVVLLAWGGWIGNFVLSLADHAQNAFFNWIEWIPVVASALAIGVLLVAVAEYRNRPFLRLAMGLMLVEIVVALIGWGFHLRAISESPMSNWWERIVFSAPVFAPLLFANLAILALIGLATLSRAAECADTRGAGAQISDANRAARMVR